MVGTDRPASHFQSGTPPTMDVIYANRLPMPGLFDQDQHQDQEGDLSCETKSALAGPTEAVGT